MPIAVFPYEARTTSNYPVARRAVVSALRSEVRAADCDEKGGGINGGFQSFFCAKSIAVSRYIQHWRYPYANVEAHPKTRQRFNILNVRADADR